MCCVCFVLYFGFEWVTRMQYIPQQIKSNQKNQQKTNNKKPNTNALDKIKTLHNNQDMASQFESNKPLPYKMIIVSNIFKHQNKSNRSQNIMQIIKNKQTNI